MRVKNVGWTHIETQQKSSAATQAMLITAFTTNLFSNLIPERGQKEVIIHLIADCIMPL